MASCPGRNVRTVPVSREVVCSRCGQDGLGWVKNAAGKWYLANLHAVDGQLCAVPGDFHRCGERQAAIAAIEKARELQPLRDELAQLEKELTAIILRRDWAAGEPVAARISALKAEIEDAAK